MQVACGFRNTFFNWGGLLFAWGSGNNGELGTGDIDKRLAPTHIASLPAHVKQVAAGPYHTGIVAVNGDLFMCGSGSKGQLGLADNEEKRTPTLINRIKFGNKPVMMVACGLMHTAVLTEGGRVYTFGLGKAGQLGHGNMQDQSKPKLVPENKFTLKGVNNQIVMVAAGDNYTVALSRAGRVHMGRRRERAARARRSIG